jgi:DNA polymerase I-like protein with 3'-5' exonuclease and polymerase domains
MTKLTWDAVANSTGVVRDWAYNAGDVMGTLEVAETLLPRLGPEQARTYAFHRGLQTPALGMMFNGVLVDEELCKRRLKELRRDMTRITKEIDKLPVMQTIWDGTEKETGLCDANEGKHHKWPRGVPDGPDRMCERCGASRIKRRAFLPSSDKDKPHLFYDLLGLQPIYNKERKITCDGEALSKMGRKRPDLLPLVTLILEYQDVKKQMGFLGAPRTPEGRYPSSFNVAAAWTSRFSSSKNPFRQGGNLQNVAEKNRDIFVADPGYWLFYADLEQAESNVVAHLAGDEEYIAAHRLGDPHTFVSRLVFPDLAWTGDLDKDKAIAKNTYMDWDKAPGHDIRFQSKRIQHGGNYGLTPPGIAMIAHIPQNAALLMYRKYHSNFPGIQVWQRKEKAAIKAHEPLINPLGYRVKLFGRPDDEHTYKQGLSMKPQSTVAHLINIAMWRVDREMQGRAILLAQVHDALLGMVKIGDYEALRQILDLMAIPLDVTGADGKTRRFTIGTEIAVGLNWGKASPSNPTGLTTWKPT